MNEPCTHPPTALIEQDLTPSGITAIVTACTLCNSQVDYRPLRQKDVEAKYGTGAYPRVNGALVNGASTPEPVTQPTTRFDEPLPTLPNKKQVRGPGELCGLEGGSLLICSSGVGQAHACVNSKWGDKRRRREGTSRPGSCDGPCSCHCHRSPEWKARS